MGTEMRNDRPTAADYAYELEETAHIVMTSDDFDEVSMAFDVHWAIFEDFSSEYPHAPDEWSAVVVDSNFGQYTVNVYN